MDADTINLEFLSAEGLTTKDKLVILTDLVLVEADQATLASTLGVPLASVRSSLAKAGKIDLSGAKSEHRELMEALISVCEYDRSSMRQKDWSHLAKVASDLQEAGATPNEIKARAHNLRRRMHLPVTPGSLDKYWPQLADRDRFSPASVYGR